MIGDAVSVVLDSAFFFFGIFWLVCAVAFSCKSELPAGKFSFTFRFVSLCLFEVVCDQHNNMLYKKFLESSYRYLQISILP